MDHQREPSVAAASPTRVVNARDLPSDWRTLPGYVYCGRAGRGLDGAYGNPHSVGWCGTCQVRHRRGEALAAFDAEATARYAADPEYRSLVERLRGKTLVCFCRPRQCHCDTYVRLLGEAA